MAHVHAFSDSSLAAFTGTTRFAPWISRKRTGQGWKAERWLAAAWQRHWRKSLPKDTPVEGFAGLAVAVLKLARDETLKAFEILDARPVPISAASLPKHVPEGHHVARKFRDKFESRATSEAHKALLDAVTWLVDLILTAASTVHPWITEPGRLVRAESVWNLLPDRLTKFLQKPESGPVRTT